MLKFDNGTKAVLLEGHKNMKEELENMRDCFSEVKSKVNTEIRNAVNEGSMSGNYARALDSECTEIMNDISNFENRIMEGITKIDEKIAEIDAGIIYEELTPEQFFSTQGTCSIAATSSEVVDAVNVNRKNQIINVTTTTVMKSKKEVKAPYKEPVTVQKEYPASEITITGYKDDNFVVALIDGINVVIR